MFAQAVGDLFLRETGVLNADLQFELEVQEISDTPSISSSVAGLCSVESHQAMQDRNFVMRMDSSLFSPV